MLEKLKQVAERIRSLREITGLSVATIAGKLKINKALLEGYEKRRQRHTGQHSL